MGMIKKKTAVRGTEGGVKYICDICSVDITSTVSHLPLATSPPSSPVTDPAKVRIHCAHPDCKGEYDLCVPCFSEGAKSSRHDPSTHPYQVVEQHSVPIFTDDWGADEEMLMLEGAETYGLGSWADIADHIGGFRDKDEVRDHYVNTYVNSASFPLPQHCNPADRSLIEEWPREKFQARKRRRIEERKDEAKNASPAQPKKKPVSSVPSCHEVQGFMPGRLEFETEHYNEAEEAVQHMQFEPGEGVNEKTGELDPEMILKMTVMDIYNNKLTARVERKRFIFDHQLLEYRKNQALEKKKSKEERDLFNRCKPLARMLRKNDFDDFTKDLEYETNLRQAITQLQEWRQMQVSDLKSGERYEQEKSQRLAKIAAQSNYDRFATARPVKAAVQQAETNVAVQNLTGSDLELRPLSDVLAASGGGSEADKSRVLTNGTGNANAAGPTVVPLAQRPKFSAPPLNNVPPFKFNNENTPDLHLLNADERDLCSQLRIMPKAYTAMKDSVLREAMKQGGAMRKKTAREICRIDSTKGSRLFDFFVYSGWIAKA